MKAIRTNQASSRRGLGFIAQSAWLELRDEFAAHDAELLFDVPGVRVAYTEVCQCGEVLKGVIKPWECKVFGTACTPETPIGTCMVSSEGACAATTTSAVSIARVAVALGHRNWTFANLPTLNYCRCAARHELSQ